MNSIDFLPEGFSVRRATAEDIPFLAQAIFHAECGTGNQTTYQSLFGLKGLTTLGTLMQLMAEELEGCELFPEHFCLIADAAQEPAAACAAWVEAETGIASGMLKAQALSLTLGPEVWQAAQPKLQALATVNIPRTAGALQLESFFVVPDHRGKGLVQALLAHQLHHAQQNPNGAPTQAEIQLVAGNAPALAAYQKAGFTPTAQTHSAEPLVQQILNGPGRIRLQRALP